MSQTPDFAVLLEQPATRLTRPVFRIILSGDESASLAYIDRPWEPDALPYARQPTPHWIL